MMPNIRIERTVVDTLATHVERWSKACTSVLLGTMLSFTSVNINAQLYSCATNSGGILFTNTPCDPSRTLSVDGVPYEEVKRKEQAQRRAVERQAKESHERAKHEENIQTTRKFKAEKVRIAAEEEAECRTKVRAENPQLFRGAIAPNLRGVTLDDALCKRSPYETK